MEQIAKTIIILAVAMLGLVPGLCYGESISYVAGNNENTKVIYDNTGNIEAVIHYSKPHYQKRFAARSTGRRYSTKGWEAREKINAILSKRHW